MKLVQAEMKQGFSVVATSSRSQGAVMVLGPRGSTGGPDNRHPGSDQWIYVVSGTGEAVVENETVSLASGSMLLIEAGEAHEIRSTIDRPLEMVTFYSPPEY